MLFKPQAETQLDGVCALLLSWNAEADSFRAAAEAARHGEAPSSNTVNAAEGMYGGLMELLGDIDQALERLPAGHKDFATLLKAQMMAMNLLEALGTSLDVLERFATRAVPAPTRIEHRGEGYAEAAE
jgi:hypothetical protein